MPLYINNVLQGLVRVGASRNGFIAVVVGPENVPIAEHQIPVSFMNDQNSPACYTGGNWYSHRPMKSTARPTQ